MAYTENIQHVEDELILLGLAGLPALLRKGEDGILITAERREGLVRIRHLLYSFLSCSGLKANYRLRTDYANLRLVVRYINRGALEISEAAQQVGQSGFKLGMVTTEQINEQSIMPNPNEQELEELQRLANLAQFSESAEEREQADREWQELNQRRLERVGAGAGEG